MTGVPEHPLRCVRREDGKQADKEEEQRPPHVVIMPIHRATCERAGSRRPDLAWKVIAHARRRGFRALDCRVPRGGPRGLRAAFGVSSIVRIPGLIVSVPYVDSTGCLDLRPINW